MYFNYVHYAIPVFFLFMGIEVIISFMKKYEYYDLHDSINNLSCGTIQQVIDIFLKAFLLAEYIFLYEHFRITDISKTSVWSWITCFILVDICYYWFHRASHRINIIWTSHAAHHQSEEYNYSVAVRQGTFERFFSWLFWLPLAIIGFPPVIYFACQQFDEIYQFFTHTKLVKSMGFLEKFMNTPSHHRVHHGKNPKYIDKNYGGTLIIWDKIFGTFQKEEEEVVYGTVSPLKSWNPVWANIKPFKDIIEKSKDYKLSDKILIWFKNPGWTPTSNESPIPEVDAKTYQKFRTRISKTLTFYTLFQFTFILYISTTYLDSADKIDLASRILSGLILIFSFMSLAGIISNDKKRTFYTEIVKLLLFIPILIQQNSNNLMLILMITLNTISFIWILFIKSQFSEKIDINV